MLTPTYRASIGAAILIWTYPRASAIGSRFASVSPGRSSWSHCAARRSRRRRVDLLDRMVTARSNQPELALSSQPRHLSPLRARGIGVADQLNLLGYGAAIFTTASFVPQAVKIKISRDTQSISVWMYAMFTTGVALWLVYGLMLRSPPIILANSITFILSSAILFMKLKNR